MKILFIAETVPYPPDNGGRIKTYYTLQGLSQAHEVHLVCFARDPKQFDYAVPLKKVCAEVDIFHLPRRALLEAWYLISGWLGSTGYVMRRHIDGGAMARIRSLFREGGFDAVYADHLSMAPYALACDAYRILDEHNVEYRIIERYAHTEGLSPLGILGKLEWRKLRNHETRMLKRMDKVLAVTPEDQRVLQEMAGPGTDVQVVPIGFDTKLHAPSESISVAGGQRGSTILSVGTLYWPPNIDAVLWFHEQVLPRLRASWDKSGADFVIVGSRPPQKIKNLAGPGVQVLGYVPDDELRNLYARAGVCVVPLRSGSGMRVKILEALSYGIPVVSTSVGCEGIAVTDGVDILIADDPESFAQAVRRVLSDADLAARLSRNGRKLVEERYDWSVVWKRLHQVIPAAAPVRAPAGRMAGAAVT